MSSHHEVREGHEMVSSRDFVDEKEPSTRLQIVFGRLLAPHTAHRCQQILIVKRIFEFKLGTELQFLITAVV